MVVLMQQERLAENLPYLYMVCSESLKSLRHMEGKSRSGRLKNKNYLQY